MSVSQLSLQPDLGRGEHRRLGAQDLHLQLLPRAAPRQPDDHAQAPRCAGLRRRARMGYTHVPQLEGSTVSLAERVFC
jgi:hypothetical protein